MLLLLRAKKIIYICSLLLAAQLMADNILVLQNKLPDDEVTVIVFAKKQNLTKELNRTNLKPEETVETAVPADNMVKFEVYHPALKVERGTIDIKNQKPIFTKTKSFEKDKEDQRLVLDIDTKNLNIHTKSDDNIRKSTQSTESKTVGAGAGVPRQSAVPITKTFSKTGTLGRKARERALAQRIEAQRAKTETKACKNS